MSLTQEEALKQIDEVLASVANFSSVYNTGTTETTRLAATIERLAPKPSHYRAKANHILSLGYDKFKVEPLREVLIALRVDIAQGYTQSVEEMVHGEVFDDFLDMAAELHSNGYHASAAVLAGSVLEDHLRKLATKTGLPLVGGKGKLLGVETLGQNLVKAGVFGEPQRKIIAGWYAQRTEGAHGRPEGVIAEEVGRMIPGIRDFIARLPA